MEFECNSIPYKLINDPRIRVEDKEIPTSINIPDEFREVSSWHFTGKTVTKNHKDYGTYVDKFVRFYENQNGIKDFVVNEKNVSYIIVKKVYYVTINSIEELIELAKDLKYYLIGFYSDGKLYFEDSED